MKKKVIASILAASMAAMALTGCGGGKTTSEAQSATTDETTASTEAGSTADGAEAPDLNPVSYTHLTLPTNSLV